MVFNLIKKEMRELLTRATVGVMVVISVALLFGGRAIGKTTEKASANPSIAVVNLDKGEYSAIVVKTLKTGAKVVYEGDTPEQGLSTLQSQNGAALIEIPADFSQTIASGQKATLQVEWLMKGTGVLNSLPVGVVQALLAASSSAVSQRILTSQTSLDPKAALQPVTVTSSTLFKGRQLTGVNPGDIGGMAGTSSSIVATAIMMLIIIGSSSVISSMGLEKENKTLETLLTMPVSRSTIIVSKVVGSAAVGMIMGAIYMVGFSGFVTSIGDRSAAASASTLGLSLSAGDYALVALSVFFALLAALCLSIVIGTFAENMRSAQTFTFPISGLAVFVMLLTTFQDFNTLPPVLKILTFLIPFSHPMMAMKELMTDNYGLVIAGIAYSIAFAAAMVGIAVWIFNSDRLLTGRFAFRRRAL